MEDFFGDVMENLEGGWNRLSTINKMIDHLVYLSIIASNPDLNESEITYFTTKIYENLENHINNWGTIYNAIINRKEVD